MGHRRSGPLYYALVVATTVLVVVVPAVAVYVLRVNNVVTGFWACLGLAAGLALLASVGASALWRRHRLLPETVFSDLLVWGWLRRVYTERQIDRALASLDRLGTTVSVEDRTKFLKRLAVALDERDPYLHKHSRRVSRHAAGTARRMSMHAAEIALLETAALLHDVGKLNTPAAIVEKQGPLTDGEREVMREHVTEGARLVETLGDPRLTAIVRHHHERFDGGGYPSRLKGEEIPLGARVVAVADAFDAITSARPYRDGVQDKRALDVLHEESGRQFDPEVVDAFIRYYSDRDISAFFSAVLSSPRTDFLRSLQSGLAGALAASVLASGALAASAPASTPSRKTPPAAHLAGPSPGGKRSASSSTKARQAQARAKARTAAAVIGARHARSTSSTSTTPAITARNTTSASASTSTTATSRSTKSTPAPATTLPCQPNCAPASTAPGSTTPTSTVPTTTIVAPETTATSTTESTSSTSTIETTTSTTETTTSTTETTSTTPATPTDPCANGGWRKAGYKNYGQCVADQHHHSPSS